PRRLRRILSAALRPLRDERDDCGDTVAGVIVTGVSRRQGIGAAIAERLSNDGWSVYTNGWREYDSLMRWGSDPAQEIDYECDLSNPDAPGLLVAAAERAVGPLAGLVIAHAIDVAAPLEEVTPQS